MDIEVKVQGLAELEKQLVKLGAQVGHKQLKGALMSASLPAFKRAKADAPGRIKKALVRRSHRSNKTLKSTKFGKGIGGKSAAGISIAVISKKAPFAHMVHGGTKPRYTKGKGRKIPYKNAYRGSVKPNPFLKKAWDSEGGEKALNRFQVNLKKRIMRLAK